MRQKGPKKCAPRRRGNRFWQFFSLRYVPTENFFSSPRTGRLSYFRPTQKRPEGLTRTLCRLQNGERGLVTYLEELGGPSQQWSQGAVSSRNRGVSIGTQETNGQRSPRGEKSMALRYFNSFAKPPFCYCAGKSTLFKLALRRGPKNATRRVRNFLKSRGIIFVFVYLQIGKRAAELFFPPQRFF